MINFSLALKDLFLFGPSFFLEGIASKLPFASLVKLNSCARKPFFIRRRQSDFRVVRAVFKKRCYRLPDYIYKLLVKKCEQIKFQGHTPVILDAGANIGASSIWFKQSFPDATVLAVEPNKEAADLAKKNCSWYPKIKVIHAAIGGKCGFASLVPAELSWSISTKRSKIGIKIKTIKECVKLVSNGKLVLVKVDIEGFEEDLFNDNLRWLDEVWAVFLEPHDWKYPEKKTSLSFQKAFGSRNFSIFIIGENFLYVRRDFEKH